MWKHIETLCQEDLAEHPVWEWRDNGDQEVVRPVSVPRIPATEHDTRVYIAATEFFTASGERYFGYCSPADPSGLDYTQPVMFTQAGPVAVWQDASGVVATANIIKALGMSREQVFPLCVRCQVESEGGLYSEVVNGA